MHYGVKPSFLGNPDISIFTIHIIYFIFAFILLTVDEEDGQI